MEDERKRSGMMTRDEWMAWLRESWAEAQARTHTIKTWRERCEEHPDHEGIVTEQMIRNRMQEEIDELRQAIAEAKDAVAAEREACAKVCLETDVQDWMDCAAAIRARGEQ
jgi:hypothetical protein